MKIPQTKEEAKEYLRLVRCWSMDNPQSRTDEWDQELQFLLQNLEVDE